MTSRELRKKFLDYFAKRDHAVIAGASVVPVNDPTALFITAGMQPLVPYLTGEKHPEGRRLADVQRCIRTNDIEEVGDEHHHTFFEMLGNWSLGDATAPDGIGEGYFRKEAIEMSFEFLTKELEIDKRKLAVSCFAGEDGVPKDEEAAEIWRTLGIPEDKIIFLDKANNWWGLVLGPAGPDTEIFYYVDEGYPDEASNPKSDEANWREIWNDVFMEYEIKSDGIMDKLKQKNVDTGMGLERMLGLINGEEDDYKTDVFAPIITKISEISGKKYETDKKSFRVIADHIRTAVIILGDEARVSPANTRQGYILRRLIRRAVRYGKILGIEDDFTVAVAETALAIYKDTYQELEKNKNFIKEELIKEENKFRKTLDKGEKEFAKMSRDKKISGKEAFVLFSTYGFPLELTQELAKEQGFGVDEVEFEEELAKHQELSRTASAGQFKGGLADDSDATKRLHTVAHLMLEALRRVLGIEVEQKGSNITPERLRFDVSYGEKISREKLDEVERIVNEEINKNEPVKCREMSLDEAREMGATGVFGHKYGERVKVYLVGKEGNYFSKEICGGPHVEETGGLGKLKIIKEESSSAGVRRLKAVLE